MRRTPWIPSIALGLACLAPATAQDRLSDVPDEPQGRQAKPAPIEETKVDEITSKIDETLRTYREKMGLDVETLREEVGRIQGEILELIQMRHRLDITLAELRAESPTGSRAIFNGGMGLIGPNGERVGDDAGKEQRQRDAMAQQLKSVVNGLRSELQQEQMKADHLLGQLRSLRDQLRTQEQQTEMMRRQREAMRTSQEQARKRQEDLMQKQREPKSDEAKTDETKPEPAKESKDDPEESSNR